MIKSISSPKVEIQLRIVSGKELSEYIEQVAQLRISVFRDFPYLYDGDMKYEKKYLSTYLDKPYAMTVLASDGDDIVGASTALPLSDETDEVKKPFIGKKIDPAHVFYFGESVLKKPYRGLGLGVRFFQEREAFARKLNSETIFNFKLFAFCAVERASNHPLRPDSYVPLNKFWERRGYQRQSDMQTEFSWKDAGDRNESLKTMTFWTKSVR